MALPDPLVKNPRISNAAGGTNTSLTSKTAPPPTNTPPPSRQTPEQLAMRARARARIMAQLAANRAAGQGNVQNPIVPVGKPSAGLGGEQVPGGQIIGVGSGVKRSGERGQLMEGWRNPVTGEVAGPGGTVTDRSLPDGGAPPPVDDPVDPAPDPSAVQQNRHPNRGNRQNRPGQISQEAAQALYNDNTIPHEFKGQLMELARSGNAQSFAQTLFGSGLPQETKLRLMQLFGFGGGQSTGGGPIGQPQGAPQPAPQNVTPVVPPNPQGSQYYGAF